MEHPHVKGRPPPALGLRHQRLHQQQRGRVALVSIADSGQSLRVVEPSTLLVSSERNVDGGGGGRGAAASQAGGRACLKAERQRAGRAARIGEEHDGRLGGADGT